MCLTFVEVLSASTDYRDIRKAAFQQYAVTTEYNSARIPTEMPIHHGAAVGVGFVTAALAMGVCLGINFAKALRGPDLYSLLRQIDRNLLASDIQDECLTGIAQSERAGTGDWIAIWGGKNPLICSYAPFC